MEGLETAWNAAIAIVEERFEDARDMLRSDNTADYGPLVSRLLSAIQRRVQLEVARSVNESIDVILPGKLDEKLRSILLNCLRLSPGKRAEYFASVEEAYYTGVSDVEKLTESYLSTYSPEVLPDPPAVSSGKAWPATNRPEESLVGPALENQFVEHEGKVGE